MTRVYVSMGSNIERERNTRSGLAALRAHYGPLIMSSVYDSQALGFAGDDFYNLVVAFDTTEDVHTVARTLERIEHEHGRARGTARFNSRTLDLDLLLYGDLVLNAPDLRLPRPEIVKYAFVLRPLAEIAGHERHPQDGRTYQALWQAFDKSQQPLTPVDFPVGLDAAANS